VAGKHSGANPKPDSTGEQGFRARGSSRSVQGNHEAMDGFAKVIAGVTSPAVFFSEENVKRVFAAAR
jgi:hypothetical protein